MRFIPALFNMIMWSWMAIIAISHGREEILENVEADTAGVVVSKME